MANELNPFVLKVAQPNQKCTENSSLLQQLPFLFTSMVLLPINGSKIAKMIENIKSLRSSPNDGISI